MINCGKEFSKGMFLMLESEVGKERKVWMRREMLGWIERES